MDAQDIIELIEYFRNLQDNEMKFEIEELRGYIDIRFELSRLKSPIIKKNRDFKYLCSLVNPLTLMGFHPYNF